MRLRAFSSFILSCMVFTVTLQIPRIVYAASIETPGAENDILVPTSGWLVGPSTLAVGAGQANACVMANQYSDGTLLRISGGRQKLYAMAAGFRDQAFKAGQTYAADITIGNSNERTVNAQAYDASTLLVDLSALGAFSALQSSRTMRLGVEGKTYEFAMLGIADGLKRMESCADPSGKQASVPSSPQPRIPPIATDLPPDEVDPAYRQALNNVTALPKVQDALSGNDGPIVPAVPAARVTGMRTLTSKKMPETPKTDSAKIENEATPEKTSEESGANDPGNLIDRLLKKVAPGPRVMVPASGPSISAQSAQPQPQTIPRATPPLAPSMPVLADLPEVSKPQAPSVPSQTSGMALAQTWTSDTTLRPSRTVVRGLARDMPAQEISEAQPRTSGPFGDQRWRAMRGNSLHDILTDWAQSENVRLIWPSTQDFSVKQSVATQGSFDTAVKSVMDQYTADPSRPVAHIYQDANSGQKVLMINVQSR